MTFSWIGSYNTRMHRGFGILLRTAFALTLPAGAGTAQIQAQKPHFELKTAKDWKQLRSKARTADDFRRLAQWCQTQVDLDNRKASAYEVELREYYASPLAHPHSQYPPTDLALKALIAHYHDLSRRWSRVEAQMSTRVAELEFASALK